MINSTQLEIGNRAVSLILDNVNTAILPSCLCLLQEQAKKSSPTSGPPGAASTNPFSSGATATTTSPTAEALRPSDDLLGLSGPNPFADSPPAPANNPFGGATAASPWGSPAMPSGKHLLATSTASSVANVSSSSLYDYES